jgi:hypothetical protein
MACSITLAFPLRCTASRTLIWQLALKHAGWLLFHHVRIGNYMAKQVTAYSCKIFHQIGVCQLVYRGLRSCMAQSTSSRTWCHYCNPLNTPAPTHKCQSRRQHKACSTCLLRQPIGNQACPKPNFSCAHETY